MDIKILKILTIPKNSGNVSFIYLFHFFFLAICLENIDLLFHFCLILHKTILPGFTLQKVSEQLTAMMNLHVSWETEQGGSTGQRATSPKDCNSRSRNRKNQVGPDRKET